MRNYSERRESIYQPLRANGVFSWDWLYDKEYALADLQRITKAEREELRVATVELGKVFAKAVSVVQESGPELMTELGMPAAAIEAVRLNVLPDAATLIGRFDFCRSDNGWRMLEFNSDTPGGVVEAFYVNGRVCDFYGAADPNAGLDKDLEAAFSLMLDRYRSMGYKTEHVCFAAPEWHAEDAGTTRYLLSASGCAARFVALRDLRVWDDALWAQDGAGLYPVDVLYRLHPLGLLAEDKDTDGYPTGEHVLDLIARGKLAVINPPGALLAQTKALQALIWGLHEAGEFFSPVEQDVIDCYMLPTYFENRFVGRCPYVVKPVLGREGGGVTIFDRRGVPVERDQEKAYWDQPMVYQQYQELEQAELETIEGLCQVRLVWGSFLVAGKGSALVARAGGLITDDLAYFVPVGMAK